MAKILGGIGEEMESQNGVQYAHPPPVSRSCDHADFLRDGKKVLRDGKISCETGKDRDASTHSDPTIPILSSPTTDRDKPIFPRAGAYAREEYISPLTPKGVKEGGEEKDEKKKTPKPPHPRWRHFATQLADAISTVRKINCKSKVSGWSEAFRKLHSIDEIPILRIRKVLKWYCAQIQEGDLIRDNTNFIPIAYTGAKFREKFTRIEDAMTKSIPEVPTTSSYTPDHYGPTPTEEQAQRNREEQAARRALLDGLMAGDDEE